MKIEIEFDQSYDTKGIIPIHLGRLRIGDHQARLYFGPDGKTKMIIEKAAVEDGSLILGRDFGADVGHVPMPNEDITADHGDT